MNKYEIIFKQNKHDSIKRIYETFKKTDDWESKFKLYKVALLVAGLKK